MLFSQLKHYLELFITDNALKVSPSLYCVTTSLSHGVEIISPGCVVRVSLMLFFLLFLSELRYPYMYFHEMNKFCKNTGLSVVFSQAESPSKQYLSKYMSLLILNVIYCFLLKCYLFRKIYANKLFFFSFFHLFDFLRQNM